MTFTVAGNIVIPNTGHIKKIVEKYNLTFNEQDTLKSAREQLLKTKCKHRKIRDKYDKLYRMARLAIYDFARAEGGVMKNLVFDEDSLMWSADLLKETTKDNGVVMRKEYTIQRAVLTKKAEFPLKANILALEFQENQLAAKVHVLQDVYKNELRKMLAKNGKQEIVGQLLLNKALKATQWDLPHAQKYLFEHKDGFYKGV